MIALGLDLENTKKGYLLLTLWAGHAVLHLNRIKSSACHLCDLSEPRFFVHVLGCRFVIEIVRELQLIEHGSFVVFHIHFKKRRANFVGVAWSGLRACWARELGGKTMRAQLLSLAPNAVALLQL